MTNETKTAAPQQSKAAATSTANILALIGAVQTAFTGAQDKAQQAGIAVLKHAQKYGDCSKAPMLIRALPARERNSMIGWFKLYSPIRLRMGRDADGDRVQMLKADAEGYAPFNLVTASKNPWFSDPAGLNPAPKDLDTLGDFENNLRVRIRNAMEAAKKGDRFIPTQSENVVDFASYLLAKIDEYDKAHPELTVQPAEGEGNDNGNGEAPKVAATA